MKSVVKNYLYCVFLWYMHIFDVCVLVCEMKERPLRMCVLLGFLSVGVDTDELFLVHVQVKNVRAIDVKVIFPKYRI